MPKNFVNVLLHVRLGLLSAYFLHDVVEQTPAVMESADCRALVEVNMPEPMHGEFTEWIVN